MIESLIYICSWYLVGGFDWVNDIYACITHKQQINIKYNLSSYSQIKNITDVVMEKALDKRHVAVPGVKITNIDSINENRSETWITTKKKSTVLRIN